MNPYFGKDFFGVLLLFFQRVVAFLSGERLSLVSDELQFFALCLAGVGAAFVGCFLSLSRMTMLANSLSHTVLLGIVALFFVTGAASVDDLSAGGLFLAALFTALLTTLATEFLVKVIRLQEDASIGLVFSLFFALGVVLITALSKNAHIGIEAITGNIDAVSRRDLQTLMWATAVVSGFCIVWKTPLKVVIFDPLFAEVSGLKVGILRHFLVAITALIAIASFQVVGVFLFLTLVVTPTLLLRLFSHSVEKIIWRSIPLSISFSLLSVALSRHVLSMYMLPVSTSGVYVTLLSVTFLLATLFARKKSGLKETSARHILKTYE